MYKSEKQNNKIATSTVYIQYKNCSINNFLNAFNFFHKYTYNVSINFVLRNKKMATNLTSALRKEEILYI